MRSLFSTSTVLPVVPKMHPLLREWCPSLFGHQACCPKEQRKLLLQCSNVQLNELVSVGLLPLHPCTARLPLAAPVARSLPESSETYAAGAPCTWVQRAHRLLPADMKSLLVVWVGASVEMARSSGRGCRLRQEGIPTVLAFTGPKDAAQQRQDLPQLELLEFDEILHSVVLQEKGEIQLTSGTLQPCKQIDESPGDSLDDSSDGYDDDNSCRDEDDYYAFLREMAGSFEATYDEDFFAIAMPFLRSKLDKNAVYFKFAHEGHALEKVEFYGKEIAVGDLRHSIAEMKKLPKVDLQILNESTGEVYARDGHLLSRNIIVTVRRTPIQTQKKPSVLNLEGADLFAPVRKKARVVKKVEPDTQ
eukprot:g29615.t1